jgi:hypothetical protein
MSGTPVRFPLPACRERFFFFFPVAYEILSQRNVVILEAGKLRRFVFLFLPRRVEWCGE